MLTTAEGIWRLGRGRLGWTIAYCARDISVYPCARMLLNAFNLLAYFAFAMICLTQGSSALAQRLSDPSEVVLGRRYLVRSELLDETRELLVYTPRSYEFSSKAYPVLFVLDGESNFVQSAATVDYLSSNAGLIPEMIVVGIANTDRPRDLTPHADAGHAIFSTFPTAGHADRFIQSLEFELIPWVSSQFRTENFRILTGHSYGGLFSLYASYSRPGLFQAYVAVSPAIYWNNRETLNSVVESCHRVGISGQLFIGWGNAEPAIRNPSMELVRQLVGCAGADGRMRFVELSADHSGTAQPGLYQGLSSIFRGYRMALPEYVGGSPPSLDAVVRNYAILSGRLGFVIDPTVSALNAAAMELIDRGEYDQAFMVLRANVNREPNNPYTLLQLGRALERVGCNREALLQYHKALDTLPANIRAMRDPLVGYGSTIRRLEQNSQDENCRYGAG